MSGITAEERAKYGEIFQARGQVNGYMSGSIARDVLLSSNLPPNRLERIWDLSDIDKDGNLDFEEFCIAMHLTFDCINGMDTPMSLPPQLIPPSKSHLLSYQQQQQPLYAQQTGYVQQPQPTGYGYQQQPQYTGYTPSPPPPTVEFSWDMTPQDMTTYQNIYSKYANDTGKVKFGQMEDFYSTLGLSRTDLTNAWTLVDVNHTHALTQDQCLLFYHILNQRTKGATIPKSLPPDLHTAFAGEYTAHLGERQDDKKKENKSAKLADSYVNRLGVASTSLSAKGSSLKQHEYDEEDMLKRELAELKEQVKQAEEKKYKQEENEEDRSYESFASRPLRDQFQALYDYKLRQLTDQADVEDKVRKQERDIEAARDAVRRLNRIVDDVRDKKRELESLLEERRAEVQKTLRAMNA
ncbi:cytoskeletal-regulatory complex EF hand-domain-containing protein [Halteromyces radiatus]|uniref:cytoskeletal-regulatory complex EF hand-domain-containing protein n=1 Tax=Halteromyces radiatus TaxID=101107 RepID=UPI00221FEC1B|nr:cytoskeletal-regulatory complex EF hand-domain-containing protein [Halteromyces radiatus]KAI8086582.1 cytoskeletal-regulatory complex EF hand-domain-containing protein [Halteromyces radiatus]